MMKKVLICVDGSKYGESCCRYGSWLAKRLGARIEGLYVSSLLEYELSGITDLGGGYGLQPYHVLIENIQKVEESKGKAIEKRVTQLLHKEGFSEKNYEFKTCVGQLVDVIVAEEADAEIVVLGKRGEGMNLAKSHLGASMERVVRASKLPCFIASKECREIRRVLIAYDGGVSCVKALDYLKSSKLLKDLDIYIVTAAEKESDIEMAQKYLDQGAMVAKAGGHKLVKTDLLKGIVEEEIGSYVKKNSIDLLVMGAYGHSRIRELIIGSTTTALLQRCEIPAFLFR